MMRSGNSKPLAPEVAELVAQASNRNAERMRGPGSVPVATTERSENEDALNFLERVTDKLLGN
jgi:hypothetical protein